MKYLQASYADFINSVSDTNFIRLFYPLVFLCIISLFLLALLQIIIHEGGHYIFGILTGYRFISFRIYQITFIKIEGRLRIKHYGYKGSAGQCLMQPPKTTPGKQHYVLYTMGGIIMNAMAAVISLTLALSPLSITLAFRIILLLNTFYGLGFIIINGIPNIKGEVNNDGTNLYYLTKDNQAVKSWFVQMDIIPMMQGSSTYKDLPKIMFELPEKVDLTNALIGWHKILECYYYMDSGQWERAEKCIEAFTPVIDKISKMQRNTVFAEKLFIMIKQGKNHSEIEDLYTGIRKLLNSSKNDFQTIRVRMTYEINKDPSDAMKEKIRMELSKLIESYPYQGEAVFCTGLVREIMN